MTERELLEKLAINDLCLVKSCLNYTFTKDISKDLTRFEGLCVGHSIEIKKQYGSIIDAADFYSWIDNYGQK